MWYKLFNRLNSTSSTFLSILGLTDTKGKAIFFYDGECGFCDATVRFLLSQTSPNVLSFCPLQSRFAREFFAARARPQPNLTTAYLFHGNRFYQKSSAVLQAVALGNGTVRYLGALLAIPKFIRDGAYNLVASFRQRIKIGKAGCRLLTPEERARFIEM